MDLAAHRWKRFLLLALLNARRSRCYRCATRRSTTVFFPSTRRALSEALCQTLLGHLRYVHPCLLHRGEINSRTRSCVIVEATPPLRGWQSRGEEAAATVVSRDRVLLFHSLDETRTECVVLPDAFWAPPVSALSVRRSEGKEGAVFRLLTDRSQRPLLSALINARRKITRAGEAAATGVPRDGAPFFPFPRRDEHGVRRPDRRLLGGASRGVLFVSLLAA